MSKAKALIRAPGSDMEDELDSAEQAQPSPDSNQENNAAPARKGRPRGIKAASAKFTKTKAPARRTSGGAMAGKKKAAPKKKAAAKRVPLKEQANVQNPDDTEEVDEFNAPPAEEEYPIEDVSMEEQPPAKEPPKRKKPAARGRKAAPKEPEPQSKATEKDGEFEYTPMRNGDAGFMHKLPANKDASKPAAGRKGTMKEIPETQAEPMDVDPPSVPEVEEDAIPQSTYRQTSNFGASSKTRQPPVNRRRGGSASDTERTGSDPALRRKLGDMAKKVENLEMRYNNLREVGVKEAEANFEKLKVQSEAKTKGE